MINTFKLNRDICLSAYELAEKINELIEHVEELEKKLERLEEKFYERR